MSQGRIAAFVLGGEYDADHEDSHGGLLMETISKVKKPSLYKVILHNDDFTPMEFVVEILRRFFKKSVHEATEIMLQVHHNGKALCGIYPFEIAETKVTLVLEIAKEHDYPLQCTMERVP
jgi:ATP-dependent Clp protease adaptor protein ClpS